MSETTFGGWLDDCLLRRQMTQLDLANRIGTRSGTVSQWVRGARQPSVESCYRIADALDLAPSEVLRRAGHTLMEEAGDDKEDRLVAMWRKLTPDGQTTAIEFVEFLRGKERRNA